VLWVAVLAAFGIEVLPFLVIQAVVGFSLLEVVNYMEHYGMLRQKVGEGDRQRYERVLPSHSWNSNNIATNVLLYHLQRHSDHHANPTRRYQTLRDFEESPVLPTGYAGMIVLAIVPAVWRRVMDQRVVDHFGGDVSLANISPRKRETYLRRYDAVGYAARAEAERAAGEALPGAVAEVLAARCPSCEYVYEVAAGDEHEGFAAGTAWADIPDDWCCPDCGVREKVDFVPCEPERSVA
jgi:alkane 1-monooxygenase